MSFTAVRMTVGRVLLVAGILILMFIPYLLWGTGLMTAHSQSLLRQQFTVEQHRAGATTSTTLPRKTISAPQVAPTIPAPPIGSPVGTINIPSIGLSMMVVEGTDEIRLQQGPGHYPGTPLPGQAGNAAIAGHRTTYLHPFYNLDALVAGNPIYVTTTQGTFQYDVISSESVSPNDVAVINATTTPELTLSTCTPRYSAAQRLIIHAALVASIITTPKTDPAPVTGTGTGAGTGAKGAGSKPTHPPAPAAPNQSWPVAIGWGVAVAAIITAVWVGARHTRRGARALVLVGGLFGWLVVVFVFFQALAPLLPASY